MVDPTDSSTPLDTDFVKGAAAELRALKGYIQTTVPPPILNAHITRIFKLSWDSSGNPSIDFTDFPHATISKTSTGHYTITITQIDWPMVAGTNPKAVVNLQPISTTIAQAITFTHNSASHTSTLLISNTNAAGTTYQDIVSATFIGMTITGSPTDL